MYIGLHTQEHINIPTETHTYTKRITYISTNKHNEKEKNRNSTYKIVYTQTQKLTITHIIAWSKNKHSCMNTLSNSISYMFTHTDTCTHTVKYTYTTNK